MEFARDWLIELDFASDALLLADYSYHNDDQQACETINVMHIDQVQASIDPVVTIAAQEAANVKEQQVR